LLLISFVRCGIKQLPKVAERTRVVCNGDSPAFFVVRSEKWRLSESRKCLTNEDCSRNQNGVASPSGSHRATLFFEDRSPLVKEKAPTLTLMT
jgi:hypothetical protein